MGSFAGGFPPLSFGGGRRGSGAKRIEEGKEKAASFRKLWGGGAAGPNLD